MACISHALLVTMAIAMTAGVGHAQSPSTLQETVPPPSTTAHDGSGDNQSTSIQSGSPRQVTASPCSLRVPDTISNSPANVAQATTATGPVHYTPLSGRCKFNLFVRQTYSPYTFASAGFQATWAHVTGQWPDYGGGAQGWAKRLGATLADTESRRFIQTFALSTILHQDPRYFPSRKRTILARAWYAATRVAVTRSDSGDNTFNSSEFLGVLSASALQNAYYPKPDRTFGDTMNRFGGALSSDAIGNLLREFTPDMKRLFRKHAPKKIQRIEEKLPIPAEDKL